MTQHGRKKQKTRERRVRVKEGAFYSLRVFMDEKQHDAVGDRTGEKSSDAYRRSPDKSARRRRFLERDAKTKQYHPGFKCSLLGAIAKKTGVLRTIASPHMEELKTRFNETVNLYLREGDFRICYEQVESSLHLKRSARLGSRFPLWAGASGRCFLAFMSKEDVDRILDDVEPLTPNTILDKETVFRKNEEVRRNGYAISVSELEEGVSSVAAPIFDASMHPVACLTLSGPTSRFSEEMIQALILALKASCRAISIKLGAEQHTLKILD